MIDNNSVYTTGEAAAQQESLGRYTAKTYLWMFAGLGVTFLVAVALAATGLMERLVLTAPGVMWGVIIAELVVVIVLSARLKKISAGGATAMFFLYAALTGFTFALIFLSYEVTSAIAMFGVTALVFGIMGAWGYLTKQDLSGWGKVLLFGLIGLLLVTIVNLFMNNSTMEIILSYVGVILFLAYTAYDTQKIKAYYFSFQGDTAMLKKASIISALQLYLDFINIFLYLLRLFGSRKN